MKCHLSLAFCTRFCRRKRSPFALGSRSSASHMLLKRALSSLRSLVVRKSKDMRLRKNINEAITSTMATHMLASGVNAFMTLLCTAVCR